MTPLQELVLRDAEKLAERLSFQIHSLSRKHGFSGPLCEFNTPENDLLKDAEKIQEILELVLKDRK